MRIRQGQPDDLPDLMALEAACFEPERRDSPRVFQYSLAQPRHEVWVVTENRRLIASLFLRFHPRTCRIHSIAVDPAAQGRGLGRRLLELAHERARARGCTRMSLEADARNKALVAWYEHHGYARTTRLPGYYAPKWDAFRFTRAL